jgi:hypothetical protein
VVLAFCRGRKDSGSRNHWWPEEQVLFAAICSPGSHPGNRPFK